MNFFKVRRFSTGVSIGLLLLRVVMGIAFMHHGFGKIQQPFGWMGPDAGIPTFLQAAAALSEFGGGLCLILGFLTPIATLAIAVTMAVAMSFHIFVMHDPFVTNGPGSSYELAAIYFCAAIAFFLIGPGKISLDRLIFGEREWKET